MADDGRIELLERRTEWLSERVKRLEASLAPERAAGSRATAPRVPEWIPPAPPERPPTALSPRPRRGSVPAPRDAATPRSAATPPSAATPRSPGAPRAAAAPRSAAAASQRAGLEDLVAGRVLAWAGGAAVFVGLILLFAVAISRGWVGEGARTLMGALGSFALAATGAWLHERRGRTDAAMAAAAAGIAGLFATSVVASRVYELVPALAGLTLAVATGAAATALAIRWRSRGMAVLGVLGGLAAPLLVGAPSGGVTAAILFVAALAAAAICVREGWDWLGLAAFVVVTPQWLAGLAENPPGDAGVFLTLAAFGTLFAAAAVGHDLRRRQGSAPRAASLLLLALNAFVAGASGWVVVEEHVGAHPADVWLALVAAAHLAAGIALLRDRRASRALAVAMLAVGTIAADVAIAQALNGLALAVVWTGAVAGCAVIARRVRGGALEEVAIGAGLGAHLALALLHVLVVEAPPEAVAAGEGSALGAAGVAAIAAACFASGALLDRRPDWRDLLHVVGLAALAYLAAVALDGAALVVAWAAEAAALATLARRAKSRAGAVGDPTPPEARGDADPVAAAEGPGWTAGAARSLRDRMGAEWLAGAAVPFQLGLALAGAFVLTAPASALQGGPADLGAAVVAFLAVAVAACFAAEAGRAGAILDGDPQWRIVLHGMGVAGLVWLAEVSLDGAVLVAALAGGAAVLAVLSRRLGDLPAAAGSAAVLGVALAHVLNQDVPPQALLDGSADLAAAAFALVACAVAALALGQAAPADARPAAGALAATILLYLASVTVVTMAGAGERAQMLLSALWAGVGVAALIAGLVRDHPALRTGALVLLGIALAKVFLYDLATLTAMARVASFLALGMLLLAGAFAWQRIRPRPLPDLREAPPGARG